MRIGQEVVYSKASEIIGVLGSIEIIAKQSTAYVIFTEAYCMRRS